MDGLYRPRQGRMIAGVCAGLAQRFGVPTWLVRLAMLLTLLPGGIPGFLLYLILWILIPSESTML
ncbi:MAG: PspC domain-containing protein [Chloroflexi bacterium]|nr:PspC domain-containing protein [Chloroflexota bacterium]